MIRFYHGLATAIFGPVAMAYVADLHQGSRGEKMGWFSTATLLGRFSDRHGRPPQIICGTFLAGICMVILAFSFSFLPLIGVSILLGLSISIVTSASAAHIADLSKKGSYGSAMGMLGSIMDIGHTTGLMVGGVLSVLCIFNEKIHTKANQWYL